MSDLAAVVMAVAAACGALLARAVSPAFGAVLFAVALLVRRPALVWLAVALLTSALSAAAWAGLSPPAPRALHGTVALVSDPAQQGGATRAIARLGRRRVEITARGGSGSVLSERLAGERVTVDGRLGPVAPGVRSQLAVRHVAAELVVSRLSAAGDGDLASRWANRLRRTLVKGARPLPAEQRTLFTGFVLGDDRGQSIATVDDFRQSGLSHLLVVSGENVAFVLAVAGPFLRRIPLRWRVVGGLAVLAAFGLLTRWEPSVSRAEAMAAIALTAAALGRPVSTLRVLALAVTAVLLVDPLLVRSVGFLLSVGASAGIALLARPLAARIPGPRPVAEAAAVTLAAQVGVAPVLIPVFGALPVAALPANLLAMPAAGPVMMWGLIAGVPAGLAGHQIASVLHLPTRVLVGWVGVVARWGAAAPLGHLGSAAVTAIVALVAVALMVPWPVWRRGLLVAAAVVACWPAVSLASAGPAGGDGREVTAGAWLWRADAVTVLVIDSPRPTRLLPALRGADIRRIDVVVMRRPGPVVADAVRPVLARIPVGMMLAPPGGRVTGAKTPPAGAVVRARPFTVTIDAVGSRLAVTVARAPP